MGVRTERGKITIDNSPDGNFPAHLFLHMLGLISSRFLKDLYPVFNIFDIATVIQTRTLGRNIPLPTGNITLLRLNICNIRTLSHHRPVNSKFSPPFFTSRFSAFKYIAAEEFEYSFGVLITSPSYFFVSFVSA